MKMRVSYEWLKEMVDLPADPQELVAEFVRTGTEVEGVEDTGASLKGVVTGHVLDCVPHPDSDHMHVCTVDVGQKNVGKDGKAEPLQIVCGAPNMRSGLNVAVAMIGTVLPGDFKIEKAKKRGVISFGMCCSEAELGLGNDHSGIIELPEDTPVGLDFATWSGLGDTVIDCEMTPNRPDCLSMTGVAVEVSAMLDEDTHFDLPKIQKEEGTPTAELVDVTIDDPERCPRYTARVVRGVKIGPSPDWLAKRVMAAGARTINNVVDVTNYVMFLTGQPLHAFDLGKLTEVDGKRHIVVRAARDGEVLTTLDGQERTLSSENTVISDGYDRAVALAGVMGGLNSEIDENTVDVLLESAAFNSGNISRTSRVLDLMSEASIRYERVVDANGCATVSDIAAALFESCCGATVCPGMVDAYPVPVAAPQIAFRPARARLIAGAAIEDDFMATRLTRLGCTVERTSDVVVFDFHGGGFCLGYWELDIPYCHLVADLSGAVVVNVDYPCSPEFKYPLTYTCSYEAMRWCHQHAAELGIEGARFMTMGSSAGGNIACAMVQLAAERGDLPVVGFAMNYPVLRMSFSREAPDPNRAIANERSLQYIAWEYADLAQMTEPLASPTEAGPEMRWPDMMLNVAGFDSLKGEADDFRDKLVAQGVHVDYKNYPHAEHGFTHEDLREYRADDAADAWARIARFIREH